MNVVKKEVKDVGEWVFREIVRSLYYKKNFEGRFFLRVFSDCIKFIEEVVVESSEINVIL